MFSSWPIFLILPTIALDSVQVLSLQVSAGPSSLVTIELPKGTDMRQLGPSHLRTNGIDIVTPEYVVPTFVSELDTKLLAKHYLDPEVSLVVRILIAILI